MKKLILTAAFTVAPSMALAQETPAVEGSATVAPSAQTPARADAPSSAHTVQRGDTLWDLSQRYLGSPWYWPKVWSYNPEIANPHWIYPGNAVRFYSGGDEVPTQVEVGNGPEEVDESAMVEDGEKVMVTGQIGYVPKKTITLAGSSFVTAKEIEESGKIVGSFSERSILSYPEQFYGNFTNGKAPKLGQTYIIYRNLGEIRHPVGDELVGYMTKIGGVAKVVRVEKGGYATMAITHQYAEIERGDNIGPSSEPVVHSVSTRPNEKDIKDAYVVGNAVRFLSVNGEHSVILVDKGSDDGVKPGNIFTAWRQNDFLEGDNIRNPERIDTQYPREDIGTCIAFDVKTKASTCLVVGSMREIVRGDHLEMRTNRRPSASR